MTSKASDDWGEPEGDNYVKFFTDLAPKIETGQDNMGAYYIDAWQELSAHAWNINAVVYINSQSPASTPAYGNLLLRSIA